MGAGKTSVGRRVAELSGAVFTDLDDLVVAERGRSIAEIFAREGEKAFRNAEAAALPDALDRGGVIALGGGAPLHEPSWRLIEARAVSVFLDAPLEILLARLGSGDGRPLAARGREKLGRLLEARLPRYREADHVVDASADAESVARAVLELWSQ